MSDHVIGRINHFTIDGRKHQIIPGWQRVRFSKYTATVKAIIGVSVAAVVA